MRGLLFSRIKQEGSSGKLPPHYGLALGCVCEMCNIINYLALVTQNHIPFHSNNINKLSDAKPSFNLT